MLDSARQIQAYIAGMTEEAFVANVEKQDAVLRRIESLARLPATMAGLYHVGLP